MFLICLILYLLGEIWRFVVLSMGELLIIWEIELVKMDVLGWFWGLGLFLRFLFLQISGCFRWFRKLLGVVWA